MGVFVEHMNDQFERVLEAVESRTGAILTEQKEMRQKLDKVSDYTEMTKADVKFLQMTTTSMSGDVKMLKLRSDQAKDKENTTDQEIILLKQRLDTLEAA